MRLLATQLFNVKVIEIVAEPLHYWGLLLIRKMCDCGWGFYVCLPALSHVGLILN